MTRSNLVRLMFDLFHAAEEPSAGSSFAVNDSY